MTTAARIGARDGGRRVAQRPVSRGPSWRASAPNQSAWKMGGRWNARGREMRVAGGPSTASQLTGRSPAATARARGEGHVVGQDARVVVPVVALAMRRRAMLGDEVPIDRKRVPYARSPRLRGHRSCAAPRRSRCDRRRSSSGSRAARTCTSPTPRACVATSAPSRRPARRLCAALAGCDSRACRTRLRPARPRARPRRAKAAPKCTRTRTASARCAAPRSPTSRRAR